MSFKKDLNLQRSDIIIIGDYKYLIYSLKKENVELLPISDILNGEDISVIPKILACYASLEEHSKVDRFELFCLMDQNNPLIKIALENFLKDEETRSWKN